MVRDLLAKGTLVDAKDKQNNTPLIYAVVQGIVRL